MQEETWYSFAGSDPKMNERNYDIVIVGSGAGGGTVAQQLSSLVKEGLKILVLEKGPKFQDHEFTGQEVEMASALYEHGGGYLTADKSMTLAWGCTYGGSTVVYTGTSMAPPKRVIEDWNIPDLDHADLDRRSKKFAEENNVHLIEPDLINDNNRLFVEGCKGAGYEVEQFPVNIKGCKGSSLCNLGCPNAAKQGTNRVQLPNAERNGVEVVTRADVLRIEDRAVRVRITPKPPGSKGDPSPWPEGDYRVRAGIIVLAAGVMGTIPLLLRSNLPATLPRIGENFTCHPALVLVGEHSKEIQNFVGHPKSFFVDRAVEDGFVLETCMYFPFTTAKSLTGFGEPHSKLMRAFPRLQMILVLGCDHAVPGNRVTIDRRGDLQVHYRFTNKLIESMVGAIRASARIFFAAGALRVHAPSADPPLLEANEADRIDQRIHARHFKAGRISVSAVHFMGGAHMGRTPADSVTDAWGRVHGIPWLRVADASLFPNSLEINPYLTIMSVADRTAEAVRRDAPELIRRDAQVSSP